MQNRNRAVLLNMIVSQAAAAAGGRGGRRRRRAGDEGGDRRPPQRRQEHVHQHARQRAADDRQRSARHDARQRRRAVRARRQAVRRDRHAGHPPRQEPDRPTSISTARTAPSEASAGPTSCSCSSTPRSGSAKSTSSSATTSPSNTSRASSSSTSGTSSSNTMPTDKWVRYLHDAFGTMRYAPIAFITGQTGKNVKALINHGQMLFKQSRARVSTGQLNRMLREAVRQNPPPPAQQPRAEDLLRHASRHPAADDRAVRQRSEADFEAVSALPARQVSRRAELRRSADQALSAAPPPGRRARRGDVKAPMAQLESIRAK